MILAAFLCNTKLCKVDRRSANMMSILLLLMFCVPFCDTRVITGNTKYIYILQQIIVGHNHQSLLSVSYLWFDLKNKLGGGKFCDRCSYMLMSLELQNNLSVTTGRGGNRVVNYFSGKTPLSRHSIDWKSRRTALFETLTPFWAPQLFFYEILIEIDHYHQRDILKKKSFSYHVPFLMYDVN